MLFKNRVHGLALVDDQFKLAGNLSASDLRVTQYLFLILKQGIKSSAFEHFNSSILQFFVKGTTSGLRAAIKIEESDTFEKVLTTMLKEKVHRVYIVDQYDRPQSVVTLSDLLPCLLL